MPFVLDQMRRCWGWALEEGLTTWPEVFDLCPTHCHQWAGCPTWQLSRFTLGLQTRLDLGPDTFIWHFAPGDLEWARGAIPYGEGKTLSIQWERRGDGIDWRLKASTPVRIQLPEGLHAENQFYGTELSLRIR